MDDIRENELVSDVPPPADAALRFIGTIRTPWPDRDSCPRQGRLDGPECRLVLDPVWQPALAGLDAYELI
ncbi:tRNA (N6-threonylcarbamoyladenosine(37)-N6)-methyltransferase TrmO, partial [Cribrihabitans sp. XS_ASV171]